MIYKIRAALSDDRPFLWQMLYYAAHMDESGESPESARANPDLRPYVEDFGRPSDFGVIAIDPITSGNVGAAWIRTMPANWPLYKYVDPGTPEFAIAVAPAHIGRGAGSQMLAELLASASGVYPVVALSVRANNPAKELYERMGFAVVARITNRLGGQSFIMRVALTPRR